MFLDIHINLKWHFCLKGNFVDDQSIIFTDDVSVLLLQTCESASTILQRIQIHKSNP
jgi:hypothetical protein